MSRPTIARTMFFACCFLPVALLKAQTAELDSLKITAEKATKKSDRRAEAEAFRTLARAQADAGQALDALQNGQSAVQIFESLGEKKEIFKSYTVQIVAHQLMHNGQKIVDLAQKAVDFAAETRDTSLLIDMMTNLGIGFDELNNDQKAVDCYLKCIALEDAIGESSALSHGNASSTFSSMGQFEKALFHARTAYKMADEKGDTLIMTLGKLNESYALALSQRGDEALKTISKTEFLAKKLGEVSLDRDINYLKSLAWADKKDFERAYRFHIKYYQIDSTLASTERNAKFAELETVYRTKQKEVENAQLTARVARQNGWMTGILAVLALLVGGIVFQRKQMKASVQIFETERALIEAERLRLLEEKTFNEHQLADFTHLLVEKNTAIETLKNDFEQKLAAAEAEKIAAIPHEAQQISTQLLESTILTESDWRSFRQKFERVHAGFFERFAQKVPDSTEAETRLAALTKLQMTNGEIAAMLGISPESVTKTRYRLRKKMGDQDLAGFVQEL